MTLQVRLHAYMLACVFIIVKPSTVSSYWVYVSASMGVAPPLSKYWYVASRYLLAQVLDLHCLVVCLSVGNGCMEI